MLEHAIGATALPPDALSELNVELIQKYSAFTLARIPVARVAGLASEAKRLEIRVQVVDHWDLLRMPNYTIDTRSPKLPWTGDPPRYSTGGGLFVAQFVGPILPEWLEKIRATGLQPVSYLPHNAALFGGSETAFEQLKTNAVVQFSAPYVPAFKAQPPTFTGETKKYTVQVANVPGAADTIARLNKSIIERQLEYRLYANFELRLESAKARELLNDPFVVAVEERGVWLASGERGALSATGIFPPATPQPDSYRAWLASVPFPSDYRPQRIAVADTGFCDGFTGTVHPDFRGSIYWGPSYIPGDNGHDFDGHGTAVAGMAVGDPDPAAGATRRENGTGFWYGMGVAPGASLLIQKIFDNNFNVRGNQMQWLRDARGGTTIQTQSRNEYTNVNVGRYSALDQEYDHAIVENFLGVTISAGNIYPPGGPFPTTPVMQPAVAKNVITVGGSETYRPNAGITCAAGSGTPAEWARAESYTNIAFLSRRATQDGRIKPDVVAPATLISSQFWPPLNNRIWCQRVADYIISSGTSFASPQAAAAVALMSHRHNITPITGAMAKAVLVGNAQSLHRASPVAGQDGWDMQTNQQIQVIPDPATGQGWGRVYLDDILRGNTVQTFVYETLRLSLL